MPIPTLMHHRLRLPIIGAPMFIVSTPTLVLAQCKAGVVGSFPALNARPASQLDEWLSRITEELAAHAQANPQAKVAPFAVNQIVHASNDRLEHDVRCCVKHRVPIVITSLRPPAEVVSAVHSYGGLVFHDVINLRHAEKAAAQGVDGIIAVCAVPVLLIFAFESHLLIKLAFGAKKTGASGSLIVLGLAFTVLSCTYLAIQYMLALRRTWFLIVLAAVAVAEPILLLNASRNPTGFAAVVLAIQGAGALVAFGFALRADPAAPAAPGTESRAVPEPEPVPVEIG